MHAWAREGRRITYAGKEGYNVMWSINDIKDYEYQITFEVHSFNVKTSKTIKQLVSPTSITTPSDYCDLEIVAQILQYIRRHYRHLCPYVCINN